MPELKKKHKKDDKLSRRNDLSIRNKIFISMIVLTVGCGVAVLAFSMSLFNRELNDAKLNKIEAAATVMENEIEEMKVRAQVAAFGMATNPDLIQALIDDDREAIIYIANTLKTMTQIDFCNIVDSSGYVITRTHAPEIYGDNISNQPHVRKAMDGYNTSVITQGAVILLGVYAGTPIYDSDMNMIGIISLGFRLDVQEFAYRLKELTGCEISVFIYNERISTTLIDENGTYALGQKAPEEISNRVLAGETYIFNETIWGNNVLANVSPLYSVDNEVIGKVFVGYYTAEDDNKVFMFIAIGIITTLMILMLCIIIALILSNNVERQLNRSQESLRQARDAADAANKSKSTFIANMSHEIRTPMNSIIGFSELALDDDIPDKTKQYLVSIADNGKWLLNIINDVLDSAKIESEKMVLEQIPFDLDDVVAQCQSAILPKFDEKGITLYCYTEPIADKRLLGDPVRLRQVLMNLLSNGIKFTNLGTVKLLSTVSMSDENRVTIHFEVTDSGIGMSPEQVAKIFEPFMQADDSITRKYGGTGLGLAITKNIIELMGGTLSVESTPNIGSRFSFDLEFGLIDAADVQPERVALSDITKPFFSGEVLVCEDNGLNQQVIYEHLTRVGCTPVMAGNGREGVDIVRSRLQNDKKPFDLIFMDVHMPVMDGLEAAERITNLGVKTPIVALTANVMSDSLDSYKKSGIPDYLGKPFTSQELWKCLSKYLPVVSQVAIDENEQPFEEKKLLTQLKTYFVKSNQKTMDGIKQALDSGDVEKAHRIVHTLKSNAGQINEKKLQDIAAILEKSFANGAGTGNGAEHGNGVEHELKVHINDLETELTAVLKKLAPYQSESEPTEFFDKDKSLEILYALKPMLLARSPDCMYMIDDIRKIPGSKKLMNLVDDFDFKQAVAELERLQDQLGSADDSVDQGRE